MKRKILVGLAILIFLFIILFISTPRLPGSILYRSIRDGNLDVYLIDVNGGIPQRLTDSPLNDMDPNYIAATDQIGFVSPGPDTWMLNLYTVSRTGEDRKQVTHLMGMNIVSPDWSTDGNFIAMAGMEWRVDCNEGICNREIYVADSDGANLKNLTNTPYADEWSPDWSPDGQKLVFCSDRSGDLDIYTMNRDGSDLARLAPSPGYDCNPRWSPDGQRISFESDRDGTGWHVFVMNVDGTDPQQITSGPLNDYYASWSPDGNWLVYVSDEIIDNGVFVVNVESKKRRHVLDYTFHEKKFDFSPIWIP